MDELTSDDFEHDDPPTVDEAPLAPPAPEPDEDEEVVPHG